ncbi:hypothetical protein [Schlesneria sp. T3-172]|uniref:hypothetical protein n=1 Tax=Schlesneria sphaerica TaxID=3373610 RepID=UPI0037C6486E
MQQTKAQEHCLHEAGKQWHRFEFGRVAWWKDGAGTEKGRKLGGELPTSAYGVLTLVLFSGDQRLG